MPLSILLLTGQSGSGKSTAIRALEDEGYYCVDNVPVTLAEELVRVLTSEGLIEKLALVMDIRDRRFVQEAPRLVAGLRASPHALHIVYLDAKEEALLKRYSETRRKHPLDYGHGLRAAIAHEREILAPLRELAEDTIDTTTMSPHELRQRFIELASAPGGTGKLSVALLSFGFKYGVPAEADLVFDVRFLPNPYFVSGMRERTGLDGDVAAHALDHDVGRALLTQAESFLSFLIPQYQREGKRYLTVAIGCTGGQHRSVAVAKTLGERLGTRAQVDVRHRDMKAAKAPQTVEKTS